MSVTLILESIFSQEEIYSKNINKLLKEYSRSELTKAHKSMS